MVIPVGVEDPGAEELRVITLELADRRSHPTILPVPEAAAAARARECHRHAMLQNAGAEEEAEGHRRGVLTVRQATMQELAREEALEETGCPTTLLVLHEPTLLEEVAAAGRYRLRATEEAGARAVREWLVWQE